MKTFAAAIVCPLLAAGNIFDYLHHVVDEAEQAVDRAQPLFTEIHEDLTEFKDVVHEKATVYKGLFNELKNSIK